MPVVNIIDHRKNKYRYRKVNAVAEPAWHDNRRSNKGGVDTGDKSTTATSWDYEEKAGVSLSDALKWAGGLTGETTLYLYNEQDGIGEKGNR